MTYAAPLYCEARLLNKQTQEIKESRIFMGDFPVMTEHGTFIVNGAERVVVSQLVRSPGVYFTAEEDPATGRRLFAAKLIPNRGAWLEFETSAKDLLTVKVDRKRKLPVTTLLRALAPEYGTDEALLALFADGRHRPRAALRGGHHRGWAGAARRDPARVARGGAAGGVPAPAPGGPGHAGERPQPGAEPVLQPPAVRPGAGGALQAEQAPAGGGAPGAHPDPGGPGGHRAPAASSSTATRAAPTTSTTSATGASAAVGELIQQQFRLGLLRLERNVKERMSIVEPGERHARPPWSTSAPWWRR